MTRRINPLVGVFLLAVVLGSAGFSQSRTVGKSSREVYTGTVIAIGARPGTNTRTFTLIIDNYTSGQEAQQLIQTLKAEGQDGLLKEMGKVKRGVFQLDGSVGRDISVVLSSEGEENERKITLIFERWLGFAELRRGARSVDYPFSYAELFIDDTKGKGEGTLFPAARLRVKGENTLDVENFGIYPALLKGVVRRKR